MFYRAWTGTPRYLCVVALVVVLLIPQTSPIVYAAAIVVNSTADTIADDGRCSLREAITAANTDTASGSMAGECVAGVGKDTIDLNGISGTIDLNRGLPDITSDLALDGPGADGLAIRHDTPGVYRILTVDLGATVTVSGVTMSDGYTAFEPGAGIHNRGVLILNSSRISNNASYDRGGGIYNVGTLTLNDCVVSDNRGTLGGGGIYNVGTMTVYRSTVRRNDNNTTAALSHGGGIHNAVTGTFVLSQSAVTGNTVTSGAQDNYGAGIYNAGTFTVTRSTISGNQTYADGGHGGGICNEGTLALDNSTISGNYAGFDTAYGDGGGIYNVNNGGRITMNASTISGNSSYGNGGGFWNGGGAVVAFKSSIIAGNQASSSGADCHNAATLTSLNYNLVGEDGDCRFTQQADDQVNVDPLLGPLQDNGGPTETRALRIGSPAFDAIPVLSCTDLQGAPIDTDQRGVLRPQGAGCDIGAYEAQTAELRLEKGIGPSELAEGGSAAFVLQVDNDGPLEATGLVISDTLPLGLTFVASSASQGVYESGNGAWNVGSLQPGLGATLALTATIGAGTAGKTITNVATIAAVGQFDSDLADNTSAAVLAIPARRVAYLPWVLKSYMPPATFPVHVGQPIAERPVKYQGELFYTASVYVPAALPSGGSFHLSTHPYVVTEVLVDDKLLFLLDGREVFSFDFSTGGRPVPALVEIFRTTLEQIAGQTVSVEYRDVYGSVIRASDMWLIWVP